MTIPTVIKLLAVGLGAYGAFMLLKLKEHAWQRSQTTDEVFIVGYFNIIICVLAILCMIMIL